MNKLRLKQSTSTTIALEQRLRIVVLGVILFMSLLSGCATVANPELAAKMSLDDAQAVLDRAGQDDYYCAFAQDRLQMTIIIRGRPPKNMPNGSKKHAKNGSKTGYTIVAFDYGKIDPVIHDTFIDLGHMQIFHDISQTDATDVAAAFLRFHNSSLGERQTWLEQKEKAFRAVVEQYRNSNPKPVLPEDARRAHVIALSAVREKRFKDAAEAYEQGLKVAPWWPEGQYNAGLMWAEAQIFFRAIDHMKKYLLLVPEAENARAVQDKVYEWEAKVESETRK